MADAERMDWHEFEESREAAKANDTSPENQAAVQDLIDFGQELEHLQEVIDQQEASLKELKGRKELLAKELIPDMMRRLGFASDAGKGQFSLSSGAKISLRNDMHVGCKKEDEEAMFVWFRANNLGGLIKETVHSATLKATVKELLTEGKEIPPMVNSFVETKAIITRAKKA